MFLRNTPTSLNSEVIEDLEDLLKRAKAGDVLGFVAGYVSPTGDGRSVVTVGNSNCITLLGAATLAQDRLSSLISEEMTDTTPLSTEEEEIVCQSADVVPLSAGGSKPDLRVIEKAIAEVFDPILFVAEEEVPNVLKEVTAALDEKMGTLLASCPYNYAFDVTQGADPFRARVSIFPNNPNLGRTHTFTVTRGISVIV